ncbi:hypothetical protein ABRI19_003346 [Vibrio cholerae]
MRSKPLIIVFCVSFLIFLIIMRFATVDRSGLVLPVCEKENEVVTKIDFYVTSDVMQNVSHVEVKNRIAKYIDKANIILSNSCVPLKRTLGDINVLDTSKILVSDLNSTKHQPLVFANVAKEILQKIGKFKIIEYYNNKPGHYFVIVYGDKFRGHGTNIIGSVNPNISDSMVVLDFQSQDHHLEHELGHLAGALHINSDRTVALRQFYLNFDDKDDAVKPYSGGFTCAGQSTIMYNGGSNKYPNEVLDIYSSPYITFNGKPCGDEKVAFNKKVMDEYTKKLRLLIN